MELSPSWEAATCAATQELPSITVFSILSQINPVRTISCYLSNRLYYYILLYQYIDYINSDYVCLIKQNKNKLRGFTPQANYTDRETAACRRS
jgi:hypothetical protein